MRIAQFGYGYWGPNVARNIINNKHFDLAYICDLKADRLSLAKQLYGERTRYTQDNNVIWEDPQIEAVAIATETSSHYDLISRALEYGKDVYVEKPFTTSVKQAKELYKLAQEAGRTIHVDHIMIYHPAIRKIKEIIVQGELGDLISFDCARQNLGQIKNDVSAMWDLSVHDLAIIDFLSDGAKMKKVKYIGSSIYSKKDSVSILSVKYEPGFIASCRASWLSPIKERRILIAGTEKMIVFDDVDVLNKLIVYDKGFDFDENIPYSDFVVKSRIGDAYIPKLSVEDALYNSLEHFRTCVEEKKESSSSPAAAIRIQEIMEAADPKGMI